MIGQECSQFIQAFSGGNKDKKLQIKLYNNYLERYFHGPLEEYHDNKKLTIFQDAFTLLWQKVSIGIIYIDNNNIYINKRGKTVLMTCSLYEYLKGIIKNLTQEDSRMHKALLLNDLSTIVVHEESDSGESRNRIKDIVNESLSHLLRGCSELLTMYYVNHLTRRAIMEKMAPRFTSEDSVKTQIHRCKGYLRENIKKELVAQKKGVG
jgi:hypothetical protein